MPTSPRSLYRTCGTTNSNHWCGGFQTSYTFVIYAVYPKYVELGFTSSSDVEPIKITEIILNIIIIIIIIGSRVWKYCKLHSCWLTTQGKITFPTF